ncbi:MAG TPA: LmeA family phospholipid-binding protein [Acidimicrobiales bacterium]|nr:LmeA family phospholipid-binding protein [Acidimicrobiales bacterium]
MVVAVVGVLVVADAAARGVAEDQLRQRVASRLEAGDRRVGPTSAGSVSAGISSFPFLFRLLAAGTISQIDVSAVDLTVRDVTFLTVGVQLWDVRIDRDSLVQDRRIALQSIGRGAAVVEISGDELSRLLGVPVVLEEGRAGVRVGGRLVTVAARVEGSSLVVEAGGVSLPVIEIPPLPLVSCLDGAQILPGRLRLTCTLDRVPVELAGRSLEVQL